MRKSTIKFLKVAFSHTIAWSLVGLLIGLIGIMGMQNSYVSEIQEKNFELQKNQMVLQNLLNEVKNSAEFGLKFDKINSKLIELESYMLEVESIRVYFKTKIKMPESIKEKRNIISKISNGFFSKKELVNYITQKVDVNISKIAMDNFIIAADDNDIDLLTKIAFSDLEFWFKASYYIEKNIDENNADIFTKSFIKNYRMSPNHARLMIQDAKFVTESWFERNLLIIRNAINENEYPRLIQQIDNALVNQTVNNPQ